jgi:hypothetical protein
MGAAARPTQYAALAASDSRLTPAPCHAAAAFFEASDAPEFQMRKTAKASTRKAQDKGRRVV